LVEREIQASLDQHVSMVIQAAWIVLVAAGHAGKWNARATHTSMPVGLLAVHLSSQSCQSEDLAFAETNR
jgi:hypothetical protein